MFGISLADIETPLSPESLQRIGDLGIEALRVKLSLIDPSLAEQTITTLTGFPGIILAVLDFPPAEGLRLIPQVSALVRQHRNRIQHWEIGSDPDDTPSGWPADHLVLYATCLKAMSDAIHAQDPAAKVHNGGLGRSLPKGLARLQELGADVAIDIWNVHPYMNPLMPDSRGALRYFHDMIQKTVGPSKPVWWTSIGCPGMQNPKAAPDWWLGKNPTELVQDDWLKTIQLRVPTWGVQAVFWQDLYDHPGVTGNGRDYLGLYTSEGLPKRAAKTLHERITPPFHEPQDLTS